MGGAEGVLDCPEVSQVAAGAAKTWRQAVIDRRVKLFRKHWKNRRQTPDLISRGEARDFEFVVEWYDESDDVISRSQERRRLDKLIAIGVDVNLPREQQPAV
jgi:hypothetical protein